MIKIEIQFEEELKKIYIENLLYVTAKSLLIQGFCVGHRVARERITIPVELINIFGEEKMANEASRLFRDGLILAQQYPYEDLEKILMD